MNGPSSIHKECYSCKHMREMPGDAHIRCVNPDPGMTGSAHAVRMGWFCYPLVFDPVWKTKACVNFEEADDA
jgi:hypothetical protein